LKKEKRCKQKEFVTYSTNNNRKFPKPRENYAHSGTGGLQDIKIELPHNILSVIQQAQRIEKEY
jgi:hypothetical protein